MEGTINSKDISKRIDSDTKQNSPYEQTGRNGSSKKKKTTQGPMGGRRPIQNKQRMHKKP
jgi:hypothetical protein